MAYPQALRLGKMITTDWTLGLFGLNGYRLVLAAAGEQPRDAEDQADDVEADQDDDKTEPKLPRSSLLGTRRSRRSLGIR